MHCHKDCNVCVKMTMIMTVTIIMTMRDYDDGDDDRVCEGCSWWRFVPRCMCVCMYVVMLFDDEDA